MRGEDGSTGYRQSPSISPLVGLTSGPLNEGGRVTTPPPPPLSRWFRGARVGGSAWQRVCV